VIATEPPYWVVIDLDRGDAGNGDCHKDAENPNGRNRYESKRAKPHSRSDRGEQQGAPQLGHDPAER
jgi:hypothetical protein